MKKNGYTLREILVVMIIVGVLVVLSLQTIKSQKSNFAFSCYHLLRDLKITVGHMAASTYGGSLNSFSCEKALENNDQSGYEACVASGKSSEAGASADPYILDYRTGQGFCRGLGKYLGTASSLKCSEGELNSATLSDIYGGIGAGKEENFILMNKYLIYVSKRVAGGSSKPYRIISVDLNGYSPPNEVAKDVISFAVFDNGEILPLGEAAVNNDFFRAVIKIRNILPVDASHAQAAVDSARHPAAIILSSKKKPLTFKEAYCDVYGKSENYPDYCNGYSDPSEKFNFTNDSGSAVSIPVSYCSEAKYNSDGSAAKKVNGKDYVAQCEMNIVKPQVSKFFPITQDVYSSINNNDDRDSASNEANQIYKY